MGGGDGFGLASSRLRWFQRIELDSRTRSSPSIANSLSCQLALKQTCHPFFSFGVLVLFAGTLVSLTDAYPTPTVAQIVGLGCPHHLKAPAKLAARCGPSTSGVRIHNLVCAWIERRAHPASRGADEPGGSSCERGEGVLSGLGAPRAPPFILDEPLCNVD